MEEEWQPDAIVELKISQIKKDLFEYIEKNSERIDSNIPVFYGHVLSILENSFPQISDSLHDQFIDDVSVKVLETSKKSKDVEYIEKLFAHAIRTRRSKAGKVIFDIILGIKLMDLGRYTQAIEALKKFRTVDAIICTAIAYCYYSLATEEGASKTQSGGRPSDMELRAREQMIELVRLKPPVGRLRFPQVVQDLKLNKIFWYMLKLAIEWFPQEPEFIRIGLEKAKKDGNREIRGELLKIASEKYFDDMFFLRELYHFRIEGREASGAAAVVRQMMQQHPKELEPIYYGLQLSIISMQTNAYSSFRKIAVEKGIPVNILLLQDFAFVLISGKKTEAFAILEDIKKRLVSKNHYLMLIDYLAQDTFSEDEKRVKTAKKVLLDSIDQYCLLQLRMKD
ncbi:MAG: hypothetical protein LUQ25_04680 [Methanoregulaceae archaeon]|nr:hypothetical protein [Methanoregulaceae archaeon]